jgi:hypothetical protein
MNQPECIRVSSAAELDALVGKHVTQEQPEIFWEDSHGHFQFDTEEEARQALRDPYYQRFLPDVDWTRTLVREVHAYRPYCADPMQVWLVAEKAAATHGPLIIWREQGRWQAAFGTHPKVEARTAPVAICLAALRAAGLLIEINHDRVDTQVSQFALNQLNQLNQRASPGLM